MQFDESTLFLCSQQRDLHQLRHLLCVPGQYFMLLPHSKPPIMERAEERIVSALHSTSVFPFWLFARGERNIMTFLSTPDYLNSLLTSVQRSLKNKTSAKLLQRGSQVALLPKSSLANFSDSPLSSYTCSFPLTHQMEKRYLRFYQNVCNWVWGQKECAGVVSVAIYMYILSGVCLISSHFGVPWVKNKLNHHLLCKSDSSFSVVKASVSFLWDLTSSIYIL